MDEELFPEEQPAPPARKRDYSWEALVEVCGLITDEITKDERGRVNAALTQLRELQPDDFLLADAIYDRAKLYRQVYEDMPLTPQALAGNWSQLPAKAEETRKSQVVQTNQYAGGDCETCGGDKMVVVGRREIDGGVGGHVHEDELMAPCPTCNSHADTGFWRYDGSRFRTPDPARVREMIE